MGFKEVRTGGKGTHIGGTKEDTGEAWPTEVEGYYVGVSESDDTYNPGKKKYSYTLETSTGDIAVYGRSYLDTIMRGLGAPAGQMLKITHNGMSRRPGKKPAFDYKVFQDLSNCKNLDGTAETVRRLDAEDISLDETDLDADEVALDSVVAPYTTASKGTSTTPDAARQAKVKELLANKTSARK